ncbi:hypothetical protein KP509_28G036100 [Ceratopteris richardii]|uniref:Helicase ATP-binding domain-containing protein n=1 Tax=Ceratopteris richardii TaxID=49495 RepID=A0A8T2RDD3_CERRI|nr:hypothetical protein KP509_28G036100 [Ceratopteris richardii]
MEALSMSSFGKESIEDADIDIIDIDMFNSIMQEKPPDPGELPHSHMTQEQVASVAPQWLESMNGPSAGFDDMGSTITGLEQVNPVTHEVFPVSHSPESLQSRTSSESSEFSFLSQGDPFHDSQFPFQQGGKMVASDLWQGNSLEFKHEFVDEFKPSNTLDDTKDNASCAFNAPSAQPPCKLELVDLTTDTDSDCEDELVQQHLGLTGKRNLPSWMEHSDRLSKILCTGPPKEEHYSREIQDLQNPFSLNFLHRFPTDANGYMKPETIAMAPMSLASYERTCSKASMRMPEWGTIPSNFSRGSSYANNGLQDGLFLRNILPCQLTTGKDNSRERIVNHGLEGHSSSIREEASLEEGAMTIPLLRHQRIALAWMEKREKGSECAGGILADDQGLGKTVSTIALILRQKPSTRNPSAEAVEISYDDTPTVNLDDEECNPLNEFSCPSDKGVSAKVNLGLKGRPHAGTLVVCPTSVLRQWANELKEKVSAEKPLSVHLYHGSGRTKDPNELAKHDVVLTTYSIVSMEVPKQPLPDDKEADGRNASCYGLSLLMRPEDGNTNKKKTGKGKKAETDVEKAGPLAKVAWFRVVLDEAQSIKNRRTQAARACWGLRAKRRWCLSGTPIQNTIDDLYSYFRFLKYEPYSIYKHFRSEIKEPISRDPARGYRNLQTVLQKILLRRTKNSHIDGEPIINLPEKVVCLEQVDFTSEERAFYTALETQSREQFQIYAEAGTVQSNYVNILWMLLRLRQACDHPCLVKEGHSDLSGRSNLEHARKLLPEKRRILLSVLERNCDPCTICSVCFYFTTIIFNAAFTFYLFILLNF